MSALGRIGQRIWRVEKSLGRSISLRGGEDSVEIGGAWYQRNALLSADEHREWVDCLCEAAETLGSRDADEDSQARALRLVGRMIELEDGAVARATRRDPQW